MNRLVAHGADAPWEVIDLFFVRATGSGLDVNRGWIVLVTALVAGAIALWGSFQPLSGGLVRISQFVAGAGAAAIGMALLEFGLIGDYCEGKEACEIAPGIGVFLAIIGGIALTAIAIFRPFRRKTPPAIS